MVRPEGRCLSVVSPPLSKWKEHFFLKPDLERTIRTSEEHAGGT